MPLTTWSWMLALADGDIAPQAITDLSSPGAQRLTVRLNPAARGALLEVLGSDEHRRDRRRLAPKLR